MGIVIPLPKRLEHGENVGLTEHLGEFRTRALIAFGAVAVAFTIAYIEHTWLIKALNAPLARTHVRPVTLGVAEPFMTSIKVSLYAAVAMALPVILWQVWAYIAPAFGQAARRSIVGFVVIGTGLFAIGLAFAYFVALPAAVHFLTGYDQKLYDIQVRAQDYYSFAAMSLLATALVFEAPVLMLGLVRFGVLTPLKLRKNRRIGYVVVATVAVLLPGVDPVTTAMEAVPLALLYEATIWMAVLFDRRWHPAVAEELCNDQIAS
ncbi:MAG: twin-arginine translocase subunit TatC [Thermoleophilia bacterium]|nr:twin-arginine translocase subunit TatC [Thermoleophilia bacterium]